VWPDKPPKGSRVGFASTNAMAPDQHDTSELFDELRQCARDAARQRMGRQLSSQDTPSDVAQSVVLELLAKADRIEYRGDAAARALTRQLVLSKLGRRARRMRAHPVPRSADSLPPAVDHATGPAGRVEHNEQLALLRAKISSLTAPERNVLHLHLEGMAHAEIAATLGLSVANSYKLFSRARDKLQHWLAETGLAESL